MLSARGAVSTDGILSEIVDSRPPSLRRIVTLAEAQRLWTSTSKMLRAQLIQGHSVSLPGRTCGFTFKSAVVVKDGDVRYSARTLRFGFHPAFITRFSLDTTVPRSEGKEEVKLPLEFIADDCGVSVDFLGVFLHEVFLFVGEALFRGRLLRLEFDGVASILAKRERAVISFDAGLQSDIFSIDSRKWPHDIRQLARPAILRQEATSSRPASSSSRPSSRPSRPPSALTESYAAERPDSAKVAFISSAPSGKLFADIAKVKPRRPPSSSRLPTPSSGRRPLAAHPLNAPPQPSCLGEGDEEEESVYSVLSPERRGGASAVDAPPTGSYDEGEDEGFYDEETEDQAPRGESESGFAGSRHVQFNLQSQGRGSAGGSHAPVVTAGGPTEQPEVEPGTAASCFYFGQTATNAKPEGKRRFVSQPSMTTIRSLLYGPPA